MEVSRPSATPWEALGGAPGFALPELIPTPTASDPKPHAGPAAVLTFQDSRPQSGGKFAQTTPHPHPVPRRAPLVRVQTHALHHPQDPPPEGSGENRPQETDTPSASRGSRGCILELGAPEATHRTPG